jgi:hypothetical protein
LSGKRKKLKAVGENAKTGVYYRKLNTINIQQMAAY